jgi:hypothetical protein
MRVRLTDKLCDVLAKVYDFFNIEGEFGLFEICKDSLNGYNRILNSFTSV